MGLPYITKLQLINILNNYFRTHGTSGTGNVDGMTINGITVPLNAKYLTLKSDGSILYQIPEEGDELRLKLPDDWQEYLTKQTYKNPVITLSGPVSRYEYGSEVSLSNPFSHLETNIGNITGNLTLYRNNSVVKSEIAPSETSTAISYSIAETIKTQWTYQLRGVNSLNEAITSSSITIDCYKPCWYGASSNETLTSTEGLTKLAQSTLGAITFTSSDNDYCYMVVSGTISKVTSSGFEVPVDLAQTLDVKLGTETVTYNVYRTSLKLSAGTYTFIVE